MAKDPRFRYFTDLDESSLQSQSPRNYTTEPTKSHQPFIRNISPKKDLYADITPTANVKPGKKSRNAIFDEDDSPVFPSSKLDDLKREDTPKPSRNLYSTRNYETSTSSVSTVTDSRQNGSQIGSRNGSRKSLFIPVVKDPTQTSSHAPNAPASFCTSPVASCSSTPNRSRKSSLLSTASHDIPPGDKVIYFPTRKNFIASGRFSDVFYGTCGLDHQCAVKRLHRNEETVERALEEARILRQVGSHPNIVKLFKVFNETKGQVLKDGEHVEPDTALCIALELYTGGTLWDYSQTKPELVGSRMWMRWAKQLFSAIRHLEKVGIVHYDIKPQNILLDDLQVAKLSDFGSARFVSELVAPAGKCDSHLSIFTPSPYAGIGTTAYTPPELLSEKTSDSYVGVDVYSLCSTLWVVGILGHEPFQNVQNPVYMITYIKAGFLDSGLNWPEPKEHCGKEPPSTCTSPHDHQQTWRHYGTYFGDSNGIFIPGTTSYMRFLNGDTVAPEIVDLVGKGMKQNPLARPSAGEMLKMLRVIDGSEDHIVNLEL